MLALVRIAGIAPFMTQLLGFEAMFVAMGGALLILLWWLLFSRARWYERVGAVVLIAVADVLQKYAVHPSIAGGGMGYFSYMLQIPTLCVALVGWAWVSRRLSPGPRAAAALAAAVLGCVPWALTRTGGVTGTGMADFHMALVDDARGALARPGRGRTVRVRDPDACAGVHARACRSDEAA